MSYTRQSTIDRSTALPTGPTAQANGSRRRVHMLASLVLTLATGNFVGCASWTNPIANGIPARLVPEELLADSKTALKPIPLTWLRSKPVERYQLAEGDILGIFIEGVLGDETQVPPITNFPDLADAAPSVGFPIPVGEGGSLPLPLIDPVDVDGLTLKEARDEIVDAYTINREILQPDQQRVLVSLVQPRRAKILVVRSDTANGRTTISGNQNLFSSSPAILSARGQGTGNLVDLPATEADLLSVLTQTGGLPGPEAANEVIVLKGYCESGDWPIGADGQIATPPDSELNSESNSQIIRIPLMVPQNTSRPTFRCEDILLESGDIVYVPPLDANVYYTAGLMQSREVPLPRDYDLRVVEALIRIGAPMVNGGRGTANLNGNIVNAGVGTPSPSLVSVVRRTPDGNQVVIRVDLNRALRDPRENILVKDGDVLILQETPQEAFARYIAQQFRLNFLSQFLNRGAFTGQATASLP